MVDDVLIHRNLLDLIIALYLLLDFIDDDLILLDLWTLGGSTAGSLKYFRRKRVFLFFFAIRSLFGAQLASPPHSFTNLALRNLRVLQRLISKVIIMRLIANLASMVTLTAIFVMFPLYERFVSFDGMSFGLPMRSNPLVVSASHESSIL